MAVKQFNRINDMNSITTSKFFFSCLSNYRIHMNWINSFTIRVFI